ncbi:MAG: hypothetical protein ACU0A4_09360 [Paracoccaceae bacterium]
MTSFIQTTRRRMLLGLAAASTAAATAAGADGQAAESEAPELIAMCDQLAGVVAAYKSAALRVKEIGRTWGPQWPTPADEAVRFGGDSKLHCDIHGRGIRVPRPYGNDHVHVGTPEDFQKSAERHWAQYERKMQTKSQRGAWSHKRWAERDEAAIEPARKYWSEIDRIKQASGIEAAQNAKSEALDALQNLVGRIVLFEERSITGLIIKAQAMQAWGEVDAFARAFHLDALAWADAMNETIFRQTKFA